MESSLITYSMLAIMCSMVISNDARKRFLAKEDILYRIKDNSKTKYLYFAMGLLIPFVLLSAAFVLDYEFVTRIIVVIVGIEMGILWGLIQLGDALITKTHVGKVWYTELSTLEYYNILPMKSQYFLVYKKRTKKRQEMVVIDKSDIDMIKNTMNALGVMTFPQFQKQSR